MIQRVPAGFSSEQWSAVTSGLETHPSTVNDYRKVINLLYNEYNQDIFTITREQAEAWFAKLDERQKSGELSANTVHRYKATLRSVGARIESSRIVPGYRNPFSGLVKNESRAKTSWNRSSFADPKDIHKIIEILDSLDAEDQLIVSLMLGLGLTPMQIQNLKVNDFQTRNGAVELKLDEGTILEYTNKPWKSSDYALSGMPLKYVKRSPGRTITWRYYAVCILSPEFRDQLKAYYSRTGTSQDTRSYFMTTRHLDFNYRAMHHMISVVLQKAGLENSGITPMMLSNYGKLRTWLQYKAEQENDEETLKQLAKDGSYGSWKDSFPLPLKETIEGIEKAMGPGFIREAAGLD